MARPKRKFPSPNDTNMKRMDLNEVFEFATGIGGDQWVLDYITSGIDEGVKVVHMHMKFTGTVGACPQCGTALKIHDHRERAWRHKDFSDSVCFVHAAVPRVRCPECNTTVQMQTPWADPNVSYTRLFEGVALKRMSKTSLSAVSEELNVTWDVLDDIVEHYVRRRLDSMDLSAVRWIRVDETSSKKGHRYITVFTDAETNKVIFITRGKSGDTVSELVHWLERHGGRAENIRIVSSDFGDAFVKGTREHLPNAVNVFDPFHLVCLANDRMDGDRRLYLGECRRLGLRRHSFLKNPGRIRGEEVKALWDVKNDNLGLGVSYMMKESLRQVFDYTDEVAAAYHLREWYRWVMAEGSKNFRSLAKTVRTHFKGIVLSIKYGINNGFQEGLNAKVQLTKRLANGYRDPDSLARMVYFRDGLGW